MVTNLGNTGAYIGGRGEIAVPLATDTTYRQPIPERPAKPSGLDWDSLTPTCPRCDRRSGQIDGTGLCPACRGDIPVKATPAAVTTAGDTYTEDHADDVARRFTAPTPEPVKAAPTVRAKVSRVSPHDITITLRSHADPLDPTRVAALLNDLLAALTPQTPAPAATPSPRSTAAGAGPKPAGRTRVGKPTRPAGTPSRPRKPRIDAFPLDQARLLYLDQQQTCQQIADTLDCSIVTVRRKLKAAGVPMRDDRARASGGHNRFTPTADQVAHIRRLYVDQQLSTVDIGQQLGHHPRVIRRILTDNGVTIRPPASQRARQFTDTDRADITRRYTDGQSLRDIADDYHVKPSRIRDLLDDAGIEIRPKGASTRIGEQIAALGVTAHDIKTWAYHQGLIEEILPGLVAGRLVDAYTQAHKSTTSTHEGEPAA